MIINDTRVCHLCGREYISDPRRIWVTFDFVESFIEDVKKKKAMNQNQPSLMRSRQVASIM